MMLFFNLIISFEKDKSSLNVLKIRQSHFPPYFNEKYEYIYPLPFIPIS